jgi:hypothetical protein
MGARFGVDAFVRKAETLDGTAADEVLVDNGLGVFGLYVAVPDRVWVDDNVGAMLALIETEGFVDTDAGREAGLPCQLREAGVQFALPIGGAGWARRTCGAGVMADEDVAFKRGQAENPPESRLRHADDGSVGSRAFRHESEEDRDRSFWD